MEWFADCVTRGECSVPNPLTGKPYRVDLDPASVLLLNFWTRAPQRILPHLPALLRRGYHIAFFITVLNHPRWLQPGVAGIEITGPVIEQLARLLGSEALWWRYDPILFTETIDASWHRRNFEMLCRQVWRDRTERVVLSLIQTDGPYRRAGDRLRRAANLAGERVSVPGREEFLVLAGELQGIARGYGISAEICCSPRLTANESEQTGIRQGCCLDRHHIGRLVSGADSIRSRPTRRGSPRNDIAPCGCLQARDIGTNGSCRHGCPYCYANRHLPL